MAVFRHKESYFQCPSSHGSAVDFNHASDDTRETRIFSSLIGNYKMKVKTFSDESECCITGIAVLSSGKVVLADITNKSLKLVDKQKNAVVDEIELDSGPWDIAALPGDHIAVTLPDEQHIHIMTTAGTLSIHHKIAVDGRCRSVAHHQDFLYVLCWYPNNVQVLDMKGNIWKTISLEGSAVVANPYYIRLSQNHKFLHVSDWGNNSIVNVTLQGEVSAVYEYSDLYQPSGMVVLKDGSLLVCCSWNGTIHHVSADFTEGHKEMECLSFPRSICYSPERNHVYVGEKDDYLHVFDMQFKQPIVTVKGSPQTRPFKNGAKVCTGNGSLNMDIDTKERKDAKQVQFARREATFNYKQYKEDIWFTEFFTTAAVPPNANAHTQSREHKAATHTADFATPSTANTSAQPTPTVSTLFRANNVDASRANARNTGKTRTFSSIVHKADINIKTRASLGTSFITGIAVLSSGKVVLADCSNGLLKLVDIQKNPVVDEIELDSGPWDIAALPEDKIAVTLPDNKQILIMTTAGKLSFHHRIAVNGRCRDVVYHQNCLYVLCWYPNTVSVLDMKGNIWKTISLEDSAVFAYYIRLSQNNKSLHVSDWDNNSIVNVTLQGEVSACVYKHNDLYQPSGMLVLEDGSLLVCCKWNTIHHVSADFTEGHKVMERLRYPRSICYNPERNHVYVGGQDDYLQVFDMQFKQPKADINIKTRSSLGTSFITGIAVLSSGKVVLADITNKSLKLVDKQKNAVVEEKKLDSGPWDIAALPGDHIAVTLPDEQHIHIMTTAGTLSIHHKIAVDGRCRSVTHHQDFLYVLCWYPNNVQVLDMKGNIWKTISLEGSAVVANPYYIRLSQNHKFLHVSDWGNNSIVNVTLQGEVSNVYEYSDLYQPSGMLVLEDGSLLVCCSFNDTMHHVSADLTEGHEVMDDMSYPRSICYSPERNHVYVGGEDDYLQVFDMQFKQPIVTVKGSPQSRPFMNGAKVCTGNGSLNVDIDTKERKDVKQVQFARREAIFNFEQDQEYVSSLKHLAELSITTAVPPKVNAFTQSKADTTALHTANAATPSTANTSAQPRPNVSTLVSENIVDASRANARDTRKSRTFSCIIHKADINVKTRSNRIKSYITGIAILSSDKVVIADGSNKLLKLVDMQMKAVVETKRLHYYPHDITALPENQIAVTLPKYKQLLIMATGGKLSILRSIDVNGYCRSVAYHKDCLYVVCRCPNTLSVLDMKGNIKKTVSLRDTEDFTPDYIVLSKDHKLLYVSDWDNDSIMSVTLQGEVSAVYNHGGLDGPAGIIVLDDGSLLVCCYWDGTIHHVSADLKQGQKVKAGLRKPNSICLSAGRDQICVGGEDNDLKLFDVLYE